MPCRHPITDPQSPTTLPKRRSRLRVVLVGCFIGLALAGIVEAARVLFGDNFHTVLPGRVFRCAQLSGPALERLIRAHAIRTVINLRGCGAPWPWYMDECRTTSRLNISQEDICFSAGRLPSVWEVRRLVEVLDRTEYPVLLHCRRGADRTGLASAIVLLLHTDIALEQAWQQLGLRYGHAPVGRPAYLHRFFELYRSWLTEAARQHSPAQFRQWVENDYCPGECRCRIETLEKPAPVPVGKPFAIRFRVSNTSVKPWRFQPETNTGIHARFILWNDDDQQLAAPRAGLFHAVVQPGQTIDLALAIPALKRPGSYRIMVDMVDEQQCWFFQTGSEPLEMELEARG
jgi:protein tyrosine phosphatase (PTP) superfamily phosphohydrolase (DUF442 family)